MILCEVVYISFLSFNFSLQQRNRLLASNPYFKIPISLLPDSVNVWQFYLLEFMLILRNESNV